MRAFKRIVRTRAVRWVGASFVLLFCLLWLGTPQPTRAENERVITIHHDGLQQTIVTDASTVEEALKRAEISVGEHDAVEPGLQTQFEAPGYDVNIYRGRPVAVTDSGHRYEVMTPHTSARQIAADAGLQLYDEDTFTLTRINDFVAEGGVGLKLNIQRATPVRFVLYGKLALIRTQAKTIGELFTEKQVVLGTQDGTNLPAETPITSDMSVEVWRNGVQTTTEEKAVNFPIEHIRAADKPVGYRAVQTPGKVGKRLVTFEVELKNGQEVSRKEIQSVVVEQASKQVEVVGIKSNGGLSKSKGVNMFVDGKGVTHRETYYDLVMNGVMRNCGGGTYTIREDGAKIDKDGYVLIAANLNRYPRCSVVETSLGLGKVYDTGGFVSTYPDGYDLATDWSNYDGR